MNPTRKPLNKNEKEPLKQTSKNVNNKKLSQTNRKKEN